MSASDADERRTIAEDGTQTESEPQLGGGHQSRGPALSSGGDQEPGGVVPPYEGRQTHGEVREEGGTYRDGARVGGATGPVVDGKPKAVDPAMTPGGRTTSPGDEQPAEEMSQTAPDEGSDETPTHLPGTPKGERGGA
jgi:hypothetical protein